LATTIVSPSGGSVPGMDQIDHAFGRIYNMFGNLGGSNYSTGGFGPGGVSPQPVSGSDNSLTAFWRGLSNLAGTSVPSFLEAGGNLLGTGMGVTQGGLGMTGTGFGTTQRGLETLQPSIDFYQKLLSGDPTAATAALAPTAANIANITAGATNQAGQGMPGGGYRAATLAGLPFAQAAQVGNAALQLQPAAAQALGQLGGEQAQIGAEQAGIGQGVSATGLGVGQLGTVLTGQGLQTLQNTIADILSKMGINIQGGTANLFSQVVGSL